MVRHDSTASIDKDILNKLKSFGVREVKFTGGEPFLASNLGSLVRHSNHLGIKTSVITGGTAGKKSSWQMVSRYCDIVWFSVYHTKNEYHDFIVNRKNASRSLWRNVNYAQSESCKVGMHMLLNTLLLKDLPSVLLEICERGAKAIKLLWPSRIGAAKRNWELYNLQMEEWPKIEASVKEVSRRFPNIAIALARHGFRKSDTAVDAIQDEPRLACNYGAENLWGLDPRGRLYPCCLLIGKDKYSVGHLDGLTEQTIAKALRQMVVRDERRTPSIGPGSCSGQCPGLLDGTGHDRRIAQGVVPVCPLGQVQIE